MENLFIKKIFSNENDLKNIDIQNIGVYYSTPIQNIKEEYRENYQDESDDTNCINVLINHEELNNNILIDDYLYEYDFTDESEIDFFMDNIFNKIYNNYIVFADRVTWDKKSGYNIYDNVLDCFTRSYDCSTFITGGDKTGKRLEIMEYSHDCPTGSSQIIVGLSATEYSKLENMSYNKINEFIEEQKKKIIKLEDN